MKAITIDRFTTNIFLVIMAIYLLAEFEILTPLTAISRYSFIGTVLIIFLMLMFKKGYKQKEFLTFLPAFLFQAFYILKLSEYSNGETYFSVIYQAFFFVFTYVIMIIVWKKTHIQLLAIIAFILMSLLMMIFMFFPELLNPNTIGAYAYFLSFLPLLYLIGYKDKKFNKFVLFLTIFLPLFLIYMSTVRSIFISIIIGLLTWMVWRFISRSKLFFRLYFLLILGFISIFTIIYPKLNTILPNYTHYEYLMIKYTGKSIMSGRQVVWNELIELIQIKPYFGYGAGALPEHFMNTTLSAHNLYLQVSLQVGIVGLILLIIFLIFIWNSLWNNRTDPKVILVACYYIGILVYQVFEVTLTQNNFGITIFQWLVIGLGLSFVFNKKQEHPS